MLSAALAAVDVCAAMDVPFLWKHGREHPQVLQGGWGWGMCLQKLAQMVDGEQPRAGAGGGRGLPGCVAATRNEGVCKPLALC